MIAAVKTKGFPYRDRDLEKIAKNAADFFAKAREAIAARKDLQQQGRELRRSALDYAKECGDLLHQCKADLDQHGGWANWVTAECDGKTSTCENYMLISKRWAKIKPVRELDQYLSINAALRLVRKSKTKPPTAEVIAAQKVVNREIKRLSEDAAKYFARNPNEILRLIEQASKKLGEQTKRHQRQIANRKTRQLV